MTVYLLAAIGAVMVGKLIQLHERRTVGQKLRTRDERHRDQLRQVRESLREQWAVEEAKYQAQIHELRKQVDSLSQQLVTLATSTLEKDVGAIIKEMADYTVRITQGDYTGQTSVEQVNLADDLPANTGDDFPSGIFIPEHERENIEWGAVVMPTRGDFMSQEEKGIIGADDN